jgi:hypothetical protein
MQGFFSGMDVKHFGDLDFIDIHQHNQVTILDCLQAIDQVNRTASGKCFKANEK